MYTKEISEVWVFYFIFTNLPVILLLCGWRRLRTVAHGILRGIGLMSSRRLLQADDVGDDNL